MGFNCPRISENFVSHLKVNARDARADAQLASFYSSELLSMYEHLCPVKWFFFLTFFECSFFYYFSRKKKNFFSFIFVM
jgi:hypothetical protein